jgi:hypothetical protein
LFLPSGKLTCNITMEKSTFSRDKSTISMAIFNSELSAITRGYTKHHPRTKWIFFLRKPSIVGRFSSHVWGHRRIHQPISHSFSIHNFTQESPECGKPNHKSSHMKVTIFMWASSPVGLWHSGLPHYL